MESYIPTGPLLALALAFDAASPAFALAPAIAPFNASVPAAFTSDTAAFMSATLAGLGGAPDGPGGPGGAPVAVAVAVGVAVAVVGVVVGVAVGVVVGGDAVVGAIGNLENSIWADGTGFPDIQRL